MQNLHGWATPDGDDDGDEPLDPKLTHCNRCASYVGISQAPKSLDWTHNRQVHENQFDSTPKSSSNVDDVLFIANQNSDQAASIQNLRRVDGGLCT